MEKDNCGHPDGGGWLKAGQFGGFKLKCCIYMGFWRWKLGVSEPFYINIFLRGCTKRREAANPYSTGVYYKNRLH